LSFYFENLFLQIFSFDLSSIDFSSFWPVSITPFIGIIIYLVRNPDKAELWGSILSQVLAFFSRKAERRSVSGNIQSRLNSFVKKLDFDDVLPYGIKFKWVTNANFESFIENGDVIVIMDTHHNNARNFVNALIAYTEQGLLPNVRNYIPNEIMQATELVLQEKIIESQRSDALQIFKKEILPKKLEGELEINTFKNVFSNLDTKGYFDTIFLSELSFSGGRLDGLLPSEAKSHIEHLIYFLKTIANRKAMDDSTPLSLQDSIFKVSLVLVAKMNIISSKGLTPYVNRIRNAFSDGQDSVYVLIRKHSLSFSDVLIPKVSKETTGKNVWKRSVFTLDSIHGRTKALMYLFR